MQVKESIIVTQLGYDIYTKLLNKYKCYATTFIIFTSLPSLLHISVYKG